MVLVPSASSVMPMSATLVRAAVLAVSKIALPVKALARDTAVGAWFVGVATVWATVPVAEFVLVLVLAEVPVPVSALGWLPSAAAMPTAPTMPSAAAPMPPLAAAPADVAVAAALAGAADAAVVPAGAVGSASAVGGVSVVNWVLCQAKSPIAGSALLSNSCGQSSA